MDNPSAFPATKGFPSERGMLLRDWFAGQALGAVVRQCAGDFMIRTPDQPETIEEYFAQKAYLIADAMLAARALPPQADKGE